MILLLTANEVSNENHGSSIQRTFGDELLIDKSIVLLLLRRTTETSSKVVKTSGSTIDKEFIS